MSNEENVRIIPIQSDGDTTDNQPLYKAYDGFIFLPSFRESYDCLVKAGEQEAASLLLRAIVTYGTEGLILTTDPRIEIVMTSIRRTIDNQRKKYKAKKTTAEQIEEQDMRSTILSLKRQLNQKTNRETLKYLDSLIR